MKERMTLKLFCDKFQAKMTNRIPCDECWVKGCKGAEQINEVVEVSITDGCLSHGCGREIVKGAYCYLHQYQRV